MMPADIFLAVPAFHFNILDHQPFVETAPVEGPLAHLPPSSVPVRRAESHENTQGIC